jgi:hypothetical protein
MSERIKNIDQKLNDPLPLFSGIRKMIFGKVKPDFYTRLTTFSSILLSILFLSWHVISYLAIFFREIIENYKQISVSELLHSRGELLGFGENQFVFHLESFHLQSIVSWTFLLVTFVFLYRKKVVFIYLFIIGITTYILGVFFWMGWSFYQQEITLFDKISVSILVAHTFVYYVFFKLELKYRSDKL